jgi:hypothetical protein
MIWAEIAWDSLLLTGIDVPGSNEVEAGGNVLAWMDSRLTKGEECRQRSL